MTMLLPLLAFLFGSLLIAAAAMAFAPAAAAAIERRLGEVTGARVKASDDEPGYDRVDDRRAEEDRQRWRRSRDRRWASCSSGWSRPATAAAKRSSSSSASGSAARCSCFALLATPIVVQPNLALALGGCGARLPAAEHGARPHGEDAASTGSGSGCPTRSICSSSASKPASASIRRFSASATSSPSRIPTCPTSCG